MKAYLLPELPYAYDALEPYIDEKTMRVHHIGHHNDYVEKLNTALEGYPTLVTGVEELLASLHTLPADIVTEVRNNAGGHANHSLFWSILSPKKEDFPNSKFKDAVTKTFGSVESFKRKFSETAIHHFASGWAWLATDRKETLKVLSTRDQDSPITQGMTPLLALDLWEHAYYLNYQNQRAEYVEAFWNLVNWKEVSLRWEEFNLKGETHREWRQVG